MTDWLSTDRLARRRHGATTPAPGPLDQASSEDIDEQFAVDFRGCWTATAAEAALMC